MTERVPSPPLCIVSVQSPQSMEAHMKQDERHHTSDDIFVGIDLTTRQHQAGEFWYSCSSFPSQR